MSNKNTARSIEQLKNAAQKADVGSFSEALILLLAQDAAKWLRIVRVQRLVERLRDAHAISQVRDKLSNADAISQIDKTIYAQFIHHLDVCRFMQEVYATIDARTMTALSSSPSQERFFSAIIRVVEIACWAFEARLFQQIERRPDSPPRPEQLAYLERQIRDVMDVGLILLNSPLAQSKEGSSDPISDPEMNQLIELAYLYEEMRQSHDLYTYGGATARIKRRSIVFKHSDQEADTAAGVASERINDVDQTRRTLLMNFDLELRKTLSAGLKDQSFARFLNSNPELSDKARNFIRAKWGDYEFEISEYFEMENQVTTSCGMFSIRELVRGWAFLTYLAVAGQEWNRRKSESEFKAAPLVELPRGYMTLTMSRLLGLEHRQARAILQQFTTIPGSRRTDLFYKPLVQLDTRRLVIATSFVLSSRFDRNIFVIVVSESELDQKKKGFLPIYALCESFRTAGFSSLTDFKVRVDGRMLTDIDLVGFKGGVLFLGQAKIVIEPDSLYDRWKAEEKLRYAAVQLRRCVEHIDQIQSDLRRLLGTSENVTKVVPFIVTNTRQFTERRFDGYPVVDVPYLSFILGGATGTLIQPTPDRPRLGSWKSFIEGEYPTEGELDLLIHATIHRVQQRGVVYSHKLRTVGNRKVHLPMMRLGSPAESRMIFLDKLDSDG